MTCDYCECGLALTVAGTNLCNECLEVAEDELRRREDEWWFVEVDAS